MSDYKSPISHLTEMRLFEILMKNAIAVVLLQL